jgi:hypothetical protein
MQSAQHRRAQSRWLSTTNTLQLFLCILVLVVASVSLHLQSDTSAVSQGLSQGLLEFKEGNPAAKKKKKKLEKEPQYYVIFSTGCSPQQNWESYVFFYHAFKVKQPGNVTRLASGCTGKETSDLRLFHEKHIGTLSERFHIHFTPDYGKEASTFKQNYKYNNKPNGVYHWMTHVLHMGNHSASVEDGIVILMDPDMILLRPLLHDFSDQNMIYAGDTPKTTVVRHGMPMAQHDGYLVSAWQEFNVSYITQGGKFPKFARNDGEFYYNSGPPYLATVRDMWNMVSCRRRCRNAGNQSLAKISLSSRHSSISKGPAVEGLRPSSARGTPRTVCRNVWIGHCHNPTQSTPYIGQINCRFNDNDRH